MATEKAMRWWGGSALALAALVGGACFLLPERYAVNAPVSHLLLGKGVDARVRHLDGAEVRLAPRTVSGLHGDPGQRAEDGALAAPGESDESDLHGSRSPASTRWSTTPNTWSDQAAPSVPISRACTIE